MADSNSTTPSCAPGAFGALHIEHTRRPSGLRYDICAPAGRVIASANNELEAQAILARINAHDDLVAALQKIAQQTCASDCMGHAMKQVAIAVLAKVSA